MSTHSQTAEVISRVIAALSELGDEERARTLRAVTSYFGDQTTAQAPSKPDHLVAQRSSSKGSFSSDRSPSPKQFLHEKQPRTDVERIACLAYYLAHYRDTPQFKTAELTTLNTEAAQLKFSNASFTTANAVKMRYLAHGEKGRRQLSAMGERFVEALPDHDAARQMMTSERRPKGRRTRKDTK